MTRAHALGGAAGVTLGVTLGMSLAATLVAVALLPAACSGGDETATPADGGGAVDAGATVEAGPVVCPEGQVACDGTCVDALQDPAHCGACDRNCLGGTCTAGVCGAVVLATGFNALVQVVPTPFGVYATGTITGQNISLAHLPDRGAPCNVAQKECLEAVPVSPDGGPPLTPSATMLVAGDSLYVQFGRALERTIYRRPLAGGASGTSSDWIPVLSSNEALGPAHAAGEGILTIREERSFLVFVPGPGADGGALQSLLEVSTGAGGGESIAFAPDSSQVFVGLERNPGALPRGLYRTTLGSPPCLDATCNVNRDLSVQALGVSGDWLYHRSGAQAFETEGTLYRRPLRGSCPSSAGCDDPRIQGMSSLTSRVVVVDPRHVYWLEPKALGVAEIRRAPLETTCLGPGAAKTCGEVFLKDALVAPYAQDERALYAFARVDGKESVVRVVK